MASSLYIDLPNLVDLAVGNTDPGVVNFGTLRILLHAIIKCLNLENIEVELRESGCSTGLCGVSTPRLAAGDNCDETTKPSKYDTPTSEDPSSDKNVPVERKNNELTEKDLRKIRHFAERKYFKTLGSSIIIRRKSSVYNLQNSNNNINFNDDSSQSTDQDNKNPNIVDDTLERFLAGGLKFADDEANKDKNKSLMSEEPTIAEFEEDIKSTKDEYYRRIEHLENEIKEIRALIQQSEALTVPNVLNELREMKRYLEFANYLVKDSFPFRGSGSQRRSSLDPLRNRDEGLIQMQKLQSVEAKLAAMNSKLSQQENDIEILRETLEEVHRRVTIVQDTSMVIDVPTEIQELKNKFDKFALLNDTIVKEYEKNTEKFNEISKVIAELNSLKADKDDIDDLLAEKADYNMLERKVSVEEIDRNKKEMDGHFNLIRDEISDLRYEITDMYSDINKHLESKLNTHEFSEMKENINDTFADVRQQLKELSVRKAQAEAAGTRSRFLKDVNCLSCTRHVWMRKEEMQKLPRVESFKPPTSIKPYLSYKLDNIRKDRSQPWSARNMNQFADILTQAGGRGTGQEKLHNRWCGGSHTILTPKDRSTKARLQALKKGLAPNTCLCVEKQEKIKEKEILDDIRTSIEKQREEREEEERKTSLEKTKSKTKEKKPRESSVSILMDTEEVKSAHSSYRSQIDEFMEDEYFTDGEYGTVEALDEYEDLEEYFDEEAEMPLEALEFNEKSGRMEEPFKMEETKTGSDVKTETNIEVKQEPAKTEERPT